MAIKEIPVRNDLYNYSFVIALDGQDYTLKFYYNQRDGFWYFSIIGFVYGWKLVHVNDIFENIKYKEGFPQGVFAVYDTKELLRNPDKDTFGDTVKLLYEEV